VRVHVVARSAGGLLAALRRRAWPDVEIAHWAEQPPEPRQVRPGDVIVLDLLELPVGSSCRQVGQCVDRIDVFAVVGPGMVDSGWLLLAGGGSVHCVECDERARRGGFAPVVQALDAHLSGLTPEELVGWVTDCEPWLGTVRDLVECLIRDPWAIRRPADLATAAGLTKPALRERCVALGCRRVEHFISAVRAAAQRCLVSRYRIPGLEAWQRVGVNDLANFSRQVKRGRRHAPPGGDGAARALLVLALGLQTALVAGCRDRSEGAGTGDASATPGADVRADSTVALPVVGALVRRGDLVLSVRATGAVRAERLVTLKAETQGTVAEVAVRPGDRVERAQVLVRLDPRPFDVAVRQAEASLGEAQIRLQEALVGDDPADSSEAVRRRREGARIRAGVTGAEARLDGARLDQERATLVAPFGGVVDRVGVVAGQRVSVGEESVRLVDLGSLIIEASVLEHDLPYVRTGGQAMVVPSASPDTRYRGTIEAVLPVVDTATRAGRVLVRVRTAYSRLRPGMYADVQLEAARLVGRVLVPAGAVIERDGRTLVFRARAGRADWVYVPVGRSNGTETEILADSVSGRTLVAPGDTVLVGGHLTLTHDAPIRVRLQEERRRP